MAYRRRIAPPRRPCRAGIGRADAAPVDVMIVGGLGKHGIDKGLGLGGDIDGHCWFPPLCSVGCSVWVFWSDLSDRLDESLDDESEEPEISDLPDSLSVTAHRPFERVRQFAVPWQDFLLLLLESSVSGIRYRSRSRFGMKHTHGLFAGEYEAEAFTGLGGDVGLVIPTL